MSQDKGVEKERLRLLQKATTEFVPEEDRLLLSGQMEDGERVGLWLTQRLLGRLVQPLLRWVEGRGLERGDPVPRGEILQRFAQQEAQARQQPEQRVQLPKQGGRWLVQAVDVADKGELLLLDFRGEGEATVRLQVSGTLLRQWLGIVYGLYRKAEWPLDFWPQWMTNAALPEPVPGLLH